MKLALYLQEKYANLVMPTIEGMKIIDQANFLARGRCPICGDSQKNKAKQRFYFYRYNEDIMVKCHNCSYSASFSRFLKDYNSPLFDSMIVEAIADNGYQKPKKKEVLYGIEHDYKISDAWKNVIFPAKEFEIGVDFLKFRQFPKDKWDRVYITDSIADAYKKICFQLNIEYHPKNYPDMPAIAFPFVDKRGVLTHVNFRNLDNKSKMRYITAEFYPGVKCFGMDKIDSTKDVYVVEGPADSLFLDNCIAMGDAALDRAKEVVSKNKLILVPDNEPWAPVQVKRIEKFIKDGYRVFIPPLNIKQKDLNDMQKQGYNVKDLVSQNVYEGLMAEFKFKDWRQ